MARSINHLDSPSYKILNTHRKACTDFHKISYSGEQVAGKNDNNFFPEIIPQSSPLSQLGASAKALLMRPGHTALGERRAGAQQFRRESS